VQSRNSLRIVLWMSSSVSRSIAAVASSKIKIFVFCKRALAKHIRCLCPTLQVKKWFEIHVLQPCIPSNCVCIIFTCLPDIFTPFGYFILQVCNPLSKVAANDFKCASSSASHICASVYRWSGSKLSDSFVRVKLMNHLKFFHPI